MADSFNEGLISLSNHLVEKEVIRHWKEGVLNSFDSEGEMVPSP